jgi:ketosteroid isomerase-like protein
MSQENVELYYRAIDAINRCDLSAFLALMDEQVDAVPRIVAMEGGLHGHEGVRRWWDEWFTTFPDYSIEIVEAEDLGDVVIATLRTGGHAASSELLLQELLWQPTRWRGRKCLWWSMFQSRTEALESVGLSE